MSRERNHPGPLPEAPGYVPILLPGDRDAFADTDHWNMVLLSASTALNPQAHSLLALARGRCRTLLLDPRTACFQFEGYMSSEELRALPYGPGTGTLATLWEARQFAGVQARRHLVQQVLETQRQLGAGALLAPYFLLARPDSSWGPITAQMLQMALDSRGPEPVGGVVCVEIDALLGPGQLQGVVATFAGLEPDFWLVMVVNYDEQAAPPQEVQAVLALCRQLQLQAPVVLAYAGRTGVLACAAGAAGYAAGGLELETLPKRYFREGLVNLKANACYLPGAMLRLPVATAQAVVASDPDAWAPDRSRRLDRTLARERLRRAFQDKRAELAQIMRDPDPMSSLRRRLDRALGRCQRVQRALGGSGGGLPSDAFHYLEVLREAAGGPPAKLPGDSGI